MFQTANRPDAYMQTDSALPFSQKTFNFIPRIFIDIRKGK
jgi:hypothetical protein